jgi:hypothetical protein
VGIGEDMTIHLGEISLIGMGLGLMFGSILTIRASQQLQQTMFEAAKRAYHNSNHTPRS